MDQLNTEKVRQLVRSRYGDIAAGEGKGCCNSTSASPSCCESATHENYALDLGYSEVDVKSAPDGANMSLGCGNPQAIAELKPGEIVLDLGSGAGFDCFLAARAVGPAGRVIGVDMTPEMLGKARKNAEAVDVDNVEFRLGEIEHLPVADSSVDVIISNCVINLSPEKEKVFSEAYRVLKPGGRLAISDVLALQELPTELKENPDMLCGCVGGAETGEKTRALLESIGFTSIGITALAESKEKIEEWFPGSDIGTYVTSASIEAVKA